jgi:hypothetical protein
MSLTSFSFEHLFVATSVASANNGVSNSSTKQGKQLNGHQSFPIPHTVHETSRQVRLKRWPKLQGSGVAMSSGQLLNRKTVTS